VGLTMAYKMGGPVGPGAAHGRLAWLRRAVGWGLDQMVGLVHDQVLVAASFS
jgi:hypothetical protein